MKIKEIWRSYIDSLRLCVVNLMFIRGDYIRI